VCRLPYTAVQQQTSKDLYDPTGYVDADGKPSMDVTCPDPKTAVVTYRKGQTFASWHQLFASAAGILPSHILKGKDRTKEMKDGYSWSGGPWVAKWNKGTDIVLTPNKNFWGPKPHLDKVVFKFQTNTAAEFQAFKSGQVEAIYPQTATRRGLGDQVGPRQRREVVVQRAHLGPSKGSGRT
jgi:peptide/nickel transport system substrate-binding protein